MTFAEILLWQKIRRRALGYQFHRQVPILEYIVDFYCHELMLIIEVDGSSHRHPEVSVKDQNRQQELEKRGIQFLRFEGGEIRTNMSDVLQVIEDWIVLHADKK